MPKNDASEATHSSTDRPTSARYGGGMVQIRVTGNGHATSEPDEAGFSFSCQGHGPEAQTALAQATETAAAVLEQLDALGVTEGRRGVQRAHVHPRTRWVQDRELREGWDAQANVECSITEPTQAFELIDRIARIERVSINGPQWRVHPENAAHDAARQLAVDAARMKAASYAEAAGLTLGALVELFEGGAQPGPMGVGGRSFAESASLEAADQTVQATVTLVFDAS